MSSVSLPRVWFRGRGDDGRVYSVVREGFQTVIDVVRPKEVIAECEWYRLDDGRKLETFKGEDGRVVAGKYRVVGGDLVVTLER